MDSAFRRAVAEARRQGDSYFAGLLPEDRILEAFGKAGRAWQGWVYSPAVTVWVFLTQRLSADHSCREAVAGLIAWRLARGRKAWSANTGAYCTARDDVPEETCAQRMRETGRRADREAPPAWRWLYAVERQADEHDERKNAEQGVAPASALHVRDAVHRQMLRQEKSKPLLASLFERLDAWHADALPKSPFGQAVQYALNLKTALRRYVEDGRLPIDNNAAERDLRGIALGRRNWLFCGSARGGRTSAVITSLIATCRRHRIEPFTWLRETLTALPELPRDKHGLISTEHLARLLPNAGR